VSTKEGAIYTSVGIGGYKSISFVVIDESKCRGFGSKCYEGGRMRILLQNDVCAVKRASM
jgi:hypothetical protein